MSAPQALGAPAHVLLTTDAVGGVWTYAVDLARGLAAGGTRVTLAVLGPPAAAGRTAALADAPGVELVETGLPLDWLAADRDEVRRAAQGVAALAWSRAVDLVHLNSPALAALASFPAPVVGVAHSCLKTWWEAVEPGPLPADFAWRAELLGEGYAACDRVLAPTAAFAAATKRAYGVTPQVVWNGRAAPAARGGAGPRRGAVTAGRLWDRGKGVATLDAAAARLDTPLTAYGPVHGPEGGSVAVSHLRLAGNVDAASLGDALAQAAVFVSAAVYEPFGLAVLEAAQAGCALVLSDIAGFRELWDGAAVFAPPGDAQGFADALRRLDGDPEETGRLGAGARLRAERYALAPFVRGVHQAYAATLARDEAAA